MTNKIDSLVKNLRLVQEQDLDAVVITSSPKGGGKSNTSLVISWKYVLKYGLICNKCNQHWIYTGKTNGKDNLTGNESLPFFEPCPNCKSEDIKKSNFNVKEYLAYDNEDVYQKIHSLKHYSPLIADEGVRFAMGEDWNTEESKRLKKLVAQCRTKHLLIFINIPKFRWIDRKYRDDMATFWIRLVKRGLALLLQPDLSEVKDPWHLDDLQKSLGSYSYFTKEHELTKKCLKIYRKHPCCLDFFKIPPIPPEIYAEYLEVRDKKAFEKKELDIIINQKDIAKIFVYNIFKNYDALKGAIAVSKNKAITYKYAEQFLGKDPVTGETIISYGTFRNWNKDIKEIILRRTKRGLVVHDVGE